MRERQRPLVAVVTDDAEPPLDALEEDFLREAAEFAGRWATRLPSASSWRAACAEIHRSCADSLDGRRMLRSVRG